MKKESGIAASAAAEKFFCATISGWTVVRAYHTDKETAKQLAIREKRKVCKDEPIESWDWESVADYFGADVEVICNGYVSID